MPKAKSVSWSDDCVSFTNVPFKKTYIYIYVFVLPFRELRASYNRKYITVKTRCLNETKYSRMDLVKFMEDCL